MNIIGIIPARFASTRFPAKALALIDGISMIQRVYNQACKSKVLSSVFVATDHQDIYNHVLSFGGNVVLTNSNHSSGTDRVYEAALNMPQLPDVIINIQGDEPLIEPEVIDSLAYLFTDISVQIATFASAIRKSEDIFNPNVVKVVISNQNEALYFSRNPIPFVRQFDKNDWLKNGPFLKHIGIYGYRFDMLQKLVQLSPSKLEIAESLEQLRWLEAGYKIKVQITDYESIGIDTPEDLVSVLSLLKSKIL